MTSTKPLPLPIIGLHGPAGCGKTTVAQCLTNTRFETGLATLDFVCCRFAGPLKDALVAMGLTHAHVDGNLKEVPSPLLGGKTPRYAMQTLGTEWGRELIGENIWASLAMAKVSDSMLQGFAVVLDDLRYDNEAAEVRRAGGIVVKMHRDGAGISSAHASEAGVSADLIDYHVTNNSTPAIAANHVAWLLDQHLKG